MSERVSSILNSDGLPFVHANGKPRPELAEHFRPKTRAARMSIDAARSGTDLDGHWQFADGLDPDSAYSQGVRNTLIRRSRYEQTSNSYYIGVIRSYVNSLIGDGPKLRMLTGNRNFNQLVERRFAEWQERVQFRRKLKAMAHALTGDGESFAILRNNPELGEEVQLDFTPFEAEQCQSDYHGVYSGRVDGIHFDEFNNITAYDILPYHPGGGRFVGSYSPVTVSASQVVHWFNLERPGAHRGIPAMTSGLASGAMARRHREATVKAAESAASIGALLTTGASASIEPDPVAAFTTTEFVHRMLMMLPMGWDAKQMKGEHPNAEYAEFHRLNISEMARGISMPYNAAACDSSTYSFASGKLDTLLFRNQIDADRKDCNDLILDRLFAAWFSEWTISTMNRDLPPTHQWDWPAHPVIDEVAHANAIDTQLKNGTLSLRQVYSDQGKDFEDELAVIAEDTFGDASEENIAKARQMVRLVNTPQHAIQYVAQLLGVSSPAPTLAPQGEPDA
jgi:capsid protein